MAASRFCDHHPPSVYRLHRTIEGSLRRWGQRETSYFSALGAKSPGDLIALAKKDPHKIIIGTNPAGTLPHLAAQLLVDLSQAPMTVVPYSSGGTNGAISDIMGGRVHVVIESRSGLKGAQFW